MHKSLTYLAPLAAMALLAGCVPAYVAPTSGETASMRYETTVGVSTRHAYISVSGTCTGKALADSPGEIRVPAGKEVLIQQGFYSNWGSFTRHCNLAATFRPIAGEKYVSSYRMDGSTGTCSMQLFHLDEDGNRIPESTAQKASACAEP